MDFHVTFEIFEQVKSGRKTHEYRTANDYWFKRLEYLDKQKTHNIVRGYTKEKIPITILSITQDTIINPSMSPHEEFQRFIKGDNYFDIHFKIGETGYL